MNNNKFNNHSVLIVDDNPNNLGILFDYLTNSELKVFVALDGESAIAQIEDSQPDLILLDVMMPGIDGFETCHRLKANSSTQDIPVIFMTALSETIDKVKGFRAGAVDYITKPIQQEEVLSRIKIHLTLQDLKKQLQEKNETLLRLNQNLEKLVETRTRQLIEQEKSAIIGRLTQGIVHNIKTPIQTIFFYKNIVENKSSKLSKPDLLAYFKKMGKAAQQINQLLDNLMYKSRMDRAIETTPVNLNEILQKELEFWDANFQFKYKVDKNYDFDENLPLIHLIHSDISQIFDNLISNALDAMWNRQEQNLTIVTRQDSERVYIDFIDNGCGISPKKLSKIFDPFYTSKPAKGQEKKPGEPTGTGLGLYTCAEIVKSLGGEILVKSEINRGSTFTVALSKRNHESRNVKT
ncbi:MAG TPA: hybrid sensor histidine kinase/response regulator [Coleofasciculaceae cyanobacterium]